MVIWFFVKAQPQTFLGESGGAVKKMKNATFVWAGPFCCCRQKSVTKDQITMAFYRFGLSIMESPILVYGYWQYYHTYFLSLTSGLIRWLPKSFGIPLALVFFGHFFIGVPEPPHPPGHVFFSIYSTPQQISCVCYLEPYGASHIFLFWGCKPICRYTRHDKKGC